MTDAFATPSLLLHSAPFKAPSDPARAAPLALDALAAARRNFYANDFAQAALQFRAALKERNLSAPDWVLLGICFRKLRKPQAALGCYQRAVECGLAEDKGHYSRLACVLIDLNQYDLALFYAEKSILGSNDRALLMNYCFVLRECKRYQESLMLLTDLHKRDPDDPAVLWELAFIGLYQEQSAKTWGAFEARQQFLKNAPPSTMTPWRGECLQGKRLLLIKEQGFGDTLLMCRYLPLLKNLGAKVSLLCGPELRPLLATLPFDQLIEQINAPQDFDYYCHMMSLPGLMGFKAESIPKPCAFQVPDTDESQRVAALTRGPGSPLSVGVCWSGSVSFANNHKRAVPVSRFLDLATGLAHARFVSLQKGPPRDELHHQSGGFLIQDISERLTDFGRTAAALEALDIVVMTDSAVAHLAATQGKPALNLLDYNAYWLYGQAAHTTPWYPSMRLLRQAQPGNWHTVFEQARQVLRCLQTHKQAEGKLSSARVLELMDAYLASGHAIGAGGERQALAP